MNKQLNWHEVQEMLAVINDKESYLKFKEDLKWRFDALSSQVGIVRWGMKEAQRAHQKNSNFANRMTMAELQNKRRNLRYQARLIHMGLEKGKSYARALANVVNEK